MFDWFWIQYLTCKYYAQGDECQDAKVFAEAMVKGFKK